MKYRTQTIHKNTNPQWDAEWIVANIPSSGFSLKGRLYDEDPGDNDDRLGNIRLTVSHIDEKWSGIREQAFGIKKRMGSKRAYFVRACAVMVNRHIHMSGEVIVSVELLGRSHEQHGGRTYTVGPCNYSHHFSPLIGRLAGTKNPRASKNRSSDGEEQEQERYK